MTTPFPIGIAAGVCKQERDVSVELLETVAFVTFGSFTRTYNHGNRDLSVTELYDPYTETSLNAKGLPNPGLPEFWAANMKTLSSLFQGRQAELRLSVSPREIGELGQMRQFLITDERWRLIDEVEVNLACPNHRGADGLHPVLAYDPDAVNERLKEWSGYPGKWAVKIAPDTPEPTLFQLVHRIAAFRPNRIVSSNTRLSDGILAGKKLSVGRGGQGGAVLLENGVKQVRMLKRMLQTHDIEIDGCGGITSAAAARQYQEAGATRGQMATVPYFLGDRAAVNVITAHAFQ